MARNSSQSVRQVPTHKGNTPRCSFSDASVKIHNEHINRGLTCTVCGTMPPKSHLCILCIGALIPSGNAQCAKHSYMQHSLMLETPILAAQPDPAVHMTWAYLRVH